MKTIYQVQRKLYFGKKYEDCDWLSECETLKEAREELKWARDQYSDNDEKYRIIRKVYKHTFYYS